MRLLNPLFRLPFALGLTLFTLAVSSVQADDWPLWRGLHWNGVSSEKGLPSSWSPEGENLLWHLPIGGRSTPVVVDDRACIITLAEPENESRWRNRIVCFESATGNVKWEYTYRVFQTDIPHHRVGWAGLAADPETGHIFSYGIEGLVHCFDRDGKVLWTRSFGEETGRISGYGGRTVTPIIDRDLLYINFLSAGWGKNFIPRDRFYALDKKTGETVWVSTPGNAPLDTTYTVPVIHTINGERQLISGNGDGGIYGLQASTGKKLWSHLISKRGINSSVVVDGSLVYASHSEENVDGSTELGRILCLDASQVTDGKPKLVWEVDGFKAGYASPVIHQGRLYAVDNSANLVAFHAKTGERLWTYNIGIAQRASPVVADGKLYISDLDGKFYILKLNGDKEPDLLDKDTFYQENGALAQINSAVAIADGRIYLQTRTDLYCIGKGGPTKRSGDFVRPSFSGFDEAPSGAAAATVQVIPAEVVLAPGAKQAFTARVFDASGRLIGETNAAWALDGLKGSVTRGRLTLASDNIPQQGTVIAKVGDIEGGARVAVRPAIPFTQDFNGLQEETVPPGWPAASGRFQVSLVDGEKVFRKLSANPRSWRTTVYIGDRKASGYVIEGDLMGRERRRRMPDMGLVSHRYTVALMGNQQQIQIRTWLSELKHFAKNVDFAWDPDIWYRMKVAVDTSAGDGPTTIRAKVWKRGEEEPGAWTIEAVDPIGNREGSPGIYGYSASEIFHDNVKVY